MLKRLYSTIIISIFFFIISAESLFAQNSITDFRSSINKNDVRFVISTSEKPQYNIFSLKSPSRLVVDLKGMDNKYKIQIAHAEKEILKSVRTNEQPDGELRIVFDLKYNIQIIKTFVLNYDELNKNYRLVIDFKKLSLDTSSGSEENVVSAIPKKEEEKKVEVVVQKNKEDGLENSKKFSEAKNKDVTIDSILDDMGFDQDTLGALMNEEGIIGGTSDDSGVMPLPASIRNRSVVTNGSIFEPIITKAEAQQKKKAEEQRIAALITKKQENKKSDSYGGQKTYSSSNDRNRQYVAYNNFSPDKFRKPVIIIDAGHGGKDPGAIGVRGTREKVVTLLFAKALKKDLEKTGKYKVYLTRSGDYFISLGGRVKKAQRLGADLFISLHADSSRNGKAKGLSVYSLSERASDKKAEALARKENKTDIIAGANFNGEYQDTIKILIDLSRRDTMNSSTEFAEITVDELQKRVKLLQNTHRYAGFAVLTAPDVPSILIELGFLSNKSDERMLKTSAYRNKVNYGLQKAIEKYFIKKGFFK